MKQKISITLLIFSSCIILSSQLYAQGEVSRITSWDVGGYTDFFSGEAGNNAQGCFRDHEGNLYFYGRVNEDYNIPGINFLAPEDQLFFIKYNNNYEAQWALSIPWQCWSMKAYMGPDSLIYLYGSTTAGSMTAGGLTLYGGGLSSIFLFILDPEDGKAIRGKVISNGSTQHYNYLMDACSDENGNVYVIMELYHYKGEISHVVFGKLSEPYRWGKPNAIAILKINSKMEEEWLHVVSPTKHVFRSFIFYHNGQIITVGQVDLNHSWAWAWEAAFVGNDTLVRADFNAPHWLGLTPFIIKFDTSGNKLFQRAFPARNDLKLTNSWVTDAILDNEGNIVVFVTTDTGNTMLIDTSLMKFNVACYDKILKFDNDVNLLWISEPYFGDYRNYRVSSRGFFLKTDRYNNIYLGHNAFVHDFVIIDGYEYDFGKTQRDYKKMGAIKLNKDGKFLDYMQVNDNSFDSTYVLVSCRWTVCPEGYYYIPMTMWVISPYTVIGGDTFVNSLYHHGPHKQFHTYYAIAEARSTRLHISSLEQHPCPGGNNGSIEIGILGGDYNYSILWAHGDTTAKVKNLPAGTYSVQVSDGKGTIVSDTFELKQGELFTSGAKVTNDINGQSKGGITTSVSGGKPPYKYLWDDSKNSTTPDLMNISEGVYKLTVSDANGCVWDTTFTVGNTGIVEEEKYGLSVYPNPVDRDKLYISMKMLHVKEVMLSLYDMSGKEVYNRLYKVSNGNLNESIPIRYPQGSYLLKIQAGEEVMWRKVEVLR